MSIIHFSAVLRTFFCMAFAFIAAMPTLLASSPFLLPQTKEEKTPVVPTKTKPAAQSPAERGIAAPKITGKKVDTTPKTPPKAAPQPTPKPPPLPPPSRAAQKKDAPSKGKTPPPPLKEAKRVLVPPPLPSANKPQAVAIPDTVVLTSGVVDSAMIMPPPRYPLQQFSTQILTLSPFRYALEVRAHKGAVTDTTINGDYIFDINGQKNTLSLHRGEALYEFPAMTNMPSDTAMSASGLVRSNLPLTLFVSHQPDGEAPTIRHFYTIEQARSSGVPTARHLPLWVSLLPILIATLLAWLLRETFFSLIIGIALGAWALYGFQPEALPMAGASLFDLLLHTLHQPFALSLVLLLLFAGAMASLITHNQKDANDSSSRFNAISTARGAQSAALGASLLPFFDHWTGMIMGGNIARPITDRTGVSREKLAYLLNSGAGAASALLVLTTLVGFQLLKTGSFLQNINPVSSLSVWLFGLQYAFYPIFTLCWVIATIVLQRDFGAMHRAEQRAQFEGKPFNSSETIEKKSDKSENANTSAQPKPYFYNALLPLFIFAMVAWAGLFSFSFNKNLLYGDPLATLSLLTQALGKADVVRALLWATSIGMVAAWLLSLGARRLSWRASADSLVEGMKNVFPYIITLVLSLTLAHISQRLFADQQVAHLLTDAVPYSVLPLVAFGVSAALAMLLGSSWNALAVAYPLLLPIIWSLTSATGMPVNAFQAAFYGSIGAILGGVLFGTQLSPLSQTNIMASASAQCPHPDHVRTQILYAIVCAILTLAMTELCLFAKLPGYVGLLLGIVLIPLLLLLIGRKPKPKTTDNAIQENNLEESIAAEPNISPAIALTSAENEQKDDAIAKNDDLNTNLTESTTTWEDREEYIETENVLVPMEEKAVEVVEVPYYLQQLELEQVKEKMSTWANISTPENTETPIIAHAQEQSDDNSTAEYANTTPFAVPLLPQSDDSADTKPLIIAEADTQLNKPFKLIADEDDEEDDGSNKNRSADTKRFL